MKRSTAQEVKEGIETNRMLGMKGPWWENHEVARATLFGDMGHYANDQPNSFYDLDQDTRDRLIAHARQDAAHALLNTKTIMLGIDSLKRLAIALIFLCLVIIGLLLKYL